MRYWMIVATLAACVSSARAQINTINGSGSTTGINSGFGNVVGSGSTLALSGNGTNTISFTLNRGPGGFNDYAVIYIDSITGGFANTSTFNDGNDPTRAAISARGSNSGNSSTGRADITFASGFQADYAIGLSQGFGGLWQLAGGGNNSLPFIASVNLTPTGTTTAPSYAFTLDLTQVGLTAGQSFDYVLTYGNPNDNSGNSFFRSDEFNGVAQSTVNGGNIGVNPVTLANNDFNRYISPAPEPASVLAICGLGGIAYGIRRRFIGK